MRNSSSLDWLRFMHTPNDYRVSHNTAFTRDNYLGFLRSFSSYCVERNYLTKNPTEGISVIGRKGKKKIRTRRTKIFRLIFTSIMSLSESPMRAAFWSMMSPIHRTGKPSGIWNIFRISLRKLSHMAIPVQVRLFCKRKYRTSPIPCILRRKQKN